MATLLSDNFDRANSTTTIGAPQVGPVPTVLSGVGGITSNQLYAPSATLIAVWDLGTVDVELQATATGTTSGRVLGLVLGGAATTDHYLVQYNLTQVELYRSNPGGFQLLYRQQTPTTNAATVVKASYKAGVIRAYHSGNLLLRVPVEQPITSTQHGVRVTHASSIRVDDLLSVDAPTITDAEPPADIAPEFAFGGGAEAVEVYRGRDTKALDLAGVS